MAKKSYFKSLLATVLVVMGSLVFASSALANGSPQPTAQVVSGGVTPVILGGNAKAHDVATGKVVVLAYVWAKGVTKKQQRQSRCRMVGRGTDVPVYTNTGRNASGGLTKFADSRRVKACFVAGHWRKVLCGNILFLKPPPKGSLKASQVRMVRSFSKVKVQLTAHAEVKVTAICGYAFAKATSRVNVSLVAFIRSRGEVASGIYNEVIAKATADAAAQISCVVTPPPPPVVVQPPPVVVQPPPPPPAKAPVVVVKQCILDGQPVSCAVSFGFTINGAGRTIGGGSNPVGDFQVGTSVTVCEVDAQGWNPDKGCETQVVNSGGNVFVFTNRKTSPPPPANRPPSVEIVGPQHVYTGGTVTYCVNASDPDGDPLSYLYSASFGSISGSGNCYLYQAPNEPGTATITVVVSDGKGGRASASMSFPVVKDEF